jgi:uncharacterized protein
VVATTYPLSQFVMKVHGRCDLSCDHCYVYEHADQSWRVKSKAMSIDTVRATAARIAEHAAAWRLPSVRVVLHGGEPLLLGPARMREVLAELTATIAPVTRLALVMQTNGVLLDPAMCDVLKAYAVKVGVSLDGDREANDRHRRYADGTSSFAPARRALKLLRTPEFRELYAGILCTIDVRNDPIRVYEALRAELPPRVDFLLPHATWAEPPLRPDGDPTPYSSWLAAIHDRWLADGRPMRIRMFDSLHSTAHGGPSGSEQIGTDPADLVVVDTDGQWEQADSIKTAFDGAPDTGMTVVSHSVDDVSRFAPIARRQLGLAGLSATCRACPVVSQCGGGLYAHRFREANGFDNPSVYCDDLRALVTHVNRATSARVEDDKGDTASLPADLVDQLAAGFGDEPTMRWLVAAELNITRGLLSGVVDAGGATDAWDVLTDIDARSPAAVDRVLAHPYVRVWAVGALRGDGADPDYLGALAGAAAVHAGVEAETEVSIRDGVVHLPTVGTIYWPTAGDGPARLTVGPGRLRIAGPGATLAVGRDERPGWWQPAREVALDGWSVRLDDGDPYRKCHRWTPAGRLGRADEHGWRDDLAEAWRVILAEVPGYATGLRAGLRTVVPLEKDPAGMMRASTARHAFGSVAAAHAAPADLAVMLVHEFQHGKLGALLDLVDLFDPMCPTQIKVGWRPDERPIEGVLQGVYAHAAVADIWRVRAGRDGGAPARETYAKYRDWTADAAVALRATDALTPLGRRFVAGVEAAMSGWPA